MMRAREDTAVASFLQAAGHTDWMPIRNTTTNIRLETSARRQEFERSVTNGLSAHGITGATVTIEWAGGYEPPRLGSRQMQDNAARAVADALCPAIECPAPSSR